MMADESRQVRRLEKLEQLNSELKTTKQSVQSQRDIMQDLKNRSHVNFKEFDNARQFNLQGCEADVADKREELQGLKEKLDAMVEENE